MPGGLSVRGVHMGSGEDWARSSREARARVRLALLNYEFVQSRHTQAALHSAIADWEKTLDGWTEDFRALVESRSKMPLAIL
jgi:hypothetical protein